MSDRPLVPLRWWEIKLLNFLVRSPRINGLYVLQEAAEEEEPMPVHPDAKPAPASYHAHATYLESLLDLPAPPRGTYSELPPAQPSLEQTKEAVNLPSFVHENAKMNKKFELTKLVEICERLYARDGFVTWKDVATALGVARQTVQIRIKTAIERGELPQETLERWQSLSSRRATARDRKTENEKERKRFWVKFKLSQENHAWLREEAALRQVQGCDLVNGLITRERENPTRDLI